MRGRGLRGPSEIDIEALQIAILRKVRDRGNMPFEDVATEAGISKSTVSRMSRGIGCPESETLRKICDWLEVPVERFFLRQSQIAARVYPTEPTPDVVEAVCLADDNLTREDARRLANIFRSAYEQFGASPGDKTERLES